MEGFIISIIATVGFSGVFLVIFFSIYYLYLRGVGGDIQDEDKNKRLRKRLKERIMK